MNEILNKIEKHIIDYYKIDTTKEYKVEYVNARELIVSERIDLVAKIKYIEAYENKYETSFFLDLYKKTIEAFSEGNFSEPGKDEKNSFEKYVLEFDRLIEDIKNNGFDESISIVPVGNNGAILDGAHRVAVLAYLDKKVPIIRFENISVDFGVEFFKNRLLDDDTIRYLLLEYCKMKNNLHCICLWPTCNSNNMNKAIKLISENFNILYQKDIKITYNGMKNFMIQIYHRFSWVGSYEDKHRGVIDKVDRCYVDNKATRMILIEAPNNESVLRIKDQIRKMVGIDNHSIHSTDNEEETIEMMELILNSNSIDFLNKANPDRYYNFNKELCKINKIIEEKNIDRDGVIIDSSGIMSLYGIRESNDIDLLATKKERGFLINNDIELHESELKYHNNTIDDLIFNPSNYLIYNRLKFINLNVLLEFKKNRNEIKDREDIKLISNIIKHNSVSQIDLFIIHLKKYIRKVQNKIKKIIKSVLIKIGLFNTLKKIKNRIK